VNPLLDDAKLKVFALKSACFLKAMSVREYAGTLSVSPRQITRTLKNGAPSGIQEKVIRFSCETLRHLWSPEAIIKVRLAADKRSDARELNELRLHLREYLARNRETSLTQAGIRAGLAKATISEWLSGTYKHNPSRINSKIRRFLESHGVQIESAVSA